MLMVERWSLTYYILESSLDSQSVTTPTVLCNFPNLSRYWHSRSSRNILHWEWLCKKSQTAAEACKQKVWFFGQEKSRSWLNTHSHTNSYLLLYRYTLTLTQIDIIQYILLSWSLLLWFSIDYQPTYMLVSTVSWLITSPTAAEWYAANQWEKAFVQRDIHNLYLAALATGDAGDVDRCIHERV